AASLNGQGSVGVAPTITVMPLRFLGPDGSGDISNAIRALDYAKSKGVKIVNTSWTFNVNDPLLKSAIEQSGALVVAAAGNHGINTDLSSPEYPADYDSPNILSVAALDNQGKFASFSNYGAATVDIGAPGTDIWSTLPGGTYGGKTGTSMAAP